MFTKLFPGTIVHNADIAAISRRKRQTDERANRQGIDSSTIQSGTKAKTAD